MDGLKQHKQTYKIGDHVRTEDLERTFSKGDTINWSYKLYKITVFVNVILPSYGLDNLPERYNEALLRNRELSMRESKTVMKERNIN